MSERAATNAKRRPIFVVGTDEAGYGPNLGPLLVGASCWRANVEVDATRDLSRETFEAPTKTRSPQTTENERFTKSKRRSKKAREEERGATLFDLTPTFDAERAPQDAASNEQFSTDSVVRRLNEALSEVSTRRGLFPLIDSKQLFGPTKSLAALERSFWLATLLANGRDGAARRELFSRASFQTALERVARERFDETTAPPWEQNVDFSLPFDSKTGGFDELSNALTRVEALFASNDVRLIDVAARRVQPREFNELVDSLGLKSDLIAEVTTSLAVETIERAARRDDLATDFAVDATEPIFVVLCDKLGGRDRYEPLLSVRFPGANARTLVEGRDASVYRLATRRGVARGGRAVEFSTEILVEIRFTAKGESNVPTALASIVAKYFRELSMIPFNDFWRRAASASDLKPTAGYPLDAKRFRAEVDETRSRLGVDDAIFWRKR